MLEDVYKEVRMRKQLILYFSDEYEEDEIKEDGIVLEESNTLCQHDIERHYWFITIFMS